MGLLDALGGIGDSIGNFTQEHPYMTLALTSGLGSGLTRDPSFGDRMGRGFAQGYEIARDQNLLQQEEEQRQQQILAAQKSAEAVTALMKVRGSGAPPEQQVQAANQILEAYAPYIDQKTISAFGAIMNRANTVSDKWEERGWDALKLGEGRNYEKTQKEGAAKAKGAERLFTAKKEGATEVEPGTEGAIAVPGTEKFITMPEEKKAVGRVQLVTDEEGNVTPVTISGNQEITVGESLGGFGRPGRTSEEQIETSVETAQQKKLQIPGQLRNDAIKAVNAGMTEREKLDMMKSGPGASGQMEKLIVEEMGKQAGIKGIYPNAVFGKNDRTGKPCWAIQTERGWVVVLDEYGLRKP